ncbi:MAG: aminoglycoside 6-adenylyltransferase [Candidatus Latescibacteria bacterium]|nr:aminoglycoside 6-adenylyltransferase [Candidatus Latescibacterota bacterium]
MRTRTEEEMLGLLLDFAAADDRIRAVLMNGSRVNPNVTPDPFQDYDIVNLVTEVEPFRREEYVVPYFGETIVVEQPLIGPWPPVDADGSYHNYNMQLADGNRIDLTFALVDTLQDRLRDSLTAVLLDKDGRISSLPPPNEGSYLVAKPTAELYYGCCTGFFFTLGSHIPKTIWRRKLPLLKFFIEAGLRDSLVMMLEWEMGIRQGFEQSMGFKGKHLERYLPSDMWSQYENTYVDSNYENLWESLFLCYRIFKESAEFVGKNCGFTFPQEKGMKVWAFLEHVRKLPPNAQTIYPGP